MNDDSALARKAFPYALITFALAGATLACALYARTGSIGPCLSDSAMPIFIGGAGALGFGVSTISVFLMSRLDKRRSS